MYSKTRKGHISHWSMGMRALLMLQMVKTQVLGGIVLLALNRSGKQSK